MNVLAQNEYRTEITISTYELTRYGLTYDELDYGNINTKKFLWEITEDIRKTCGYNINLSGKILIEVLKESEHTVKIFITSLSNKNSDDYSLKQLIKSEVQPLIAQFSCFEHLLDAAGLIENSTQSSLYEKDGEYRLILSPDKADRKNLTLILCEFSRIYENNPVELARSKEMWRLISTPFALSCLTQAFSAD